MPAHPNLEVSDKDDSGDTEFSVLVQEEDHFEVKNTDKWSSRTFTWRARGLKRPSPPPVPPTAEPAPIALPPRPVAIDGRAK
jgi:hypothetical protein